MRCPKCGYISFDYNQTCPKCNKDVSAELAKVGLPAFKPNPPSLLGILTGEANESNVGLKIDPSSSLEVTHDMEADFESAPDYEMDEIGDLDEDTEAFDLSDEDASLLDHDLDVDIESPKAVKEDLELDEPVALASKEDDDLDLDLDIPGELEEDSSKTEATASLEADEDESFKIDLDGSGESKPSAGEPVSAESKPADSLELDLDAIKFEDEELAKLEVNEETISGEDEKKKETPSKDDPGLSASSMIELKLDDLKINKTGQLEIKEQAEFAEGLKKISKSKDVDSKKEALKKPQEEINVDLDLDEDDLNLDLDKLDLEIDIEKPEDKIL
jgi:hypothetical protein